MSPVQSLVNEIRKRSLGMFVGETSLTKLASFLRGYDLALVRAGTSATSDPYLIGFRDWVQARHGGANRSWEDLILDECTNEAEAVNRFWALIDEFNFETETNGHVATSVATTQAPTSECS
jgi:hypothetical protein